MSKVELWLKTSLVARLTSLPDSLNLFSDEHGIVLHGGVSILFSLYLNVNVICGLKNKSSDLNEILNEV